MNLPFKPTYYVCVNTVILCVRVYLSASRALYERKGTPFWKRTNTDDCRCLITIWKSWIARWGLNDLIFVKTSNSKFSIFCVYLKLSLCAFTLILPARVTNVHAAMTVCSCCIPVAPSPPICNVVGKTEYFENIELTCRSEEGMPTPAYKWQSYNVNNNPRQLPLKATDGTCVCDAAQIHAERYGVKSVPHILANESIENKINVLFANKYK